MNSELTKVKFYLNYEILERVSKLPGFKKIPDTYWIVGIQSEEDTFNRYDDVFYLFKGTHLILKTTGTTNSGATGLKRFYRYNKRGVAVIKTDEIYYDLWKPGLHRGEMEALVQNTAIKYYRDGNRNTKVEELGKPYEGRIGINFHTITYNNERKSLWKRVIGSWSTGCQVCNDVKDYRRILFFTQQQKTTTYCLLKEF